MKRPGLYVAVLFLCTICLATLITTTISVIAMSFNGAKTENVNVVAIPDTHANDIRQASVRL